MYTIREALDQDFRGVCKELVKLGCDGAELAFNFGGMEPEELAAFFREIGLCSCGMHVFEKELYTPDSKMWEYAKALNAPYLSLSMTGDFSELENKCLEMCRKAGNDAAKNGSAFSYHNHAGEFIPLPDGTIPYDRIMSQCDPEQVKCELDVYWIKKANQDPVSYIRKYADRLVQLHVKDMDPEDGSFTELGKGSVDLKGCIEAVAQTPCRWLIYEQDICKKPAFESAVESIEYLKKILN
jgi:sugar phosphate isomerase/epimerase